MGMTMTQKILAAHAGLKEVTAGQLITCKLDLVHGNDITTPVAVNVFKNIHVNEVFDKNRLQLFTINIKDYDELIKDIYYEIDRFEKDLERLKKNPLLSEKDFER